MPAFQFCEEVAHRAPLIADEIVSARRAAQIGPALHAPVIHNPRLAHQSLEPLVFAQPGIGRMPKLRGGNRNHISGIDAGLVKLEGPKRRTGMEKNETEPSKAR